MNERKARHIFVTFLADLRCFSSILRIGIISGKLLSKLLKALAFNKTMKNKNDYLDF